MKRLHLLLLLFAICSIGLLTAQQVKPATVPSTAAPVKVIPPPSFDNSNSKATTKPPKPGKGPVSVDVNPKMKVVGGKVERLVQFRSKYVPARDVDVFLPRGYAPTRKFPVIYMNDGQALFDPRLNWNKQSWDVDNMAGKLVAQGKVEKFIVVAIWSVPKKRYEEYLPKKPYESLNGDEKSFIIQQLRKEGLKAKKLTPTSDQYLRFIVRELKPYIDRHYSTKKFQSTTFMMGSSMGALLSLYAICEYPTVFSRVACLSTHWTGVFSKEDNPFPDAIAKYLSFKLPSSANHKIYFDYGDESLDKQYPIIQKKIDNVMRSRGYNSKNWETRFFAGEGHSEIFWSRRLEIPLMFLLR